MRVSVECVVGVGVCCRGSEVSVGVDVCGCVRERVQVELWMDWV